MYLGEQKEEIIKEGKRIILLKQVSFRRYVDKYGSRNLVLMTPPSLWWFCILASVDMLNSFLFHWICLIAYLWIY